MSQISSTASWVVEAVGDGSITPHEGETLTNILAVQTDVVASSDLDRRLWEVEHALTGLKKETKNQRAVGSEQLRALPFLAFLRVSVPLW